MPKFKVLRGKHSEGKDKEGRPLVYGLGDIVDSKADLLKHNTPGTGPKFEAVENSKGSPKLITSSDSPPKNEKEARAALEKMDEAQLKQLALEEGVDLKGVSGKNGIINALLKS